MPALRLAEFAGRGVTYDGASVIIYELYDLRVSSHVTIVVVAQSVCAIGWKNSSFLIADSCTLSGSVLNATLSLINLLQFFIQMLTWLHQFVSAFVERSLNEGT